MRNRACDRVRAAFVTAAALLASAHSPCRLALSRADHSFVLPLILRTCLVVLIHRKIECVPLLRRAAEDDSAFSAFVVRLSLVPSPAREHVEEERVPIALVTRGVGGGGQTGVCLEAAAPHLRARESWHRCVLKRLLGNRARMK